MPLSAAEKQRRYRERRDNDPLRRAEYLEKERRKYRADLASGKKKLFSTTDRSRKTSPKKRMEEEKTNTKAKKQR